MHSIIIDQHILIIYYNIQLINICSKFQYILNINESKLLNLINIKQNNSKLFIISRFK